VQFTLPGPSYSAAWETVVDTADPEVAGRPYLPAGSDVTVIDRSFLVLKGVTKALPS